MGVRPDSVVVKTSDGEHVVRSPVPQARAYTFKIVDFLKKRPQLRDGEQLCCGWGFGAVLPLLGTDDIRTPSLLGTSLTPDRALRDGPPPEVHRHSSLAAARDFAREWIRARITRGVASDDILVLGLARPKMESLTTWLTDAGVPASFLLTEQLPGTVRLSTIHSAKGLDAARVLLFGAHELEGRGDDEARRLLYIAMTRAREELCVFYHGDSQLMEELREIVS